MQAKICDVCGQICKLSYKGKEYTLSVIDWYDSDNYNGIVDEKKFDLCEPCQNKLKLWIESKGKVNL